MNVVAIFVPTHLKAEGAFPQSAPAISIFFVACEHFIALAALANHRRPAPLCVCANIVFQLHKHGTAATFAQIGRWRILVLVEIQSAISLVAMTKCAAVELIAVEKITRSDVFANVGRRIPPSVTYFASKRDWTHMQFNPALPTLFIQEI